MGGRDPTLARNGARGKYQGGSEPIWRAPGRRNDSHEGEYDGYDGDGRQPRKKKDGTNMWLVGGVMRTRNTGVLRYLGPSDGHTLPQDALSRGGSAERANNRWLVSTGGSGGRGAASEVMDWGPYDGGGPRAPRPWDRRWSDGRRGATRGATTTRRRPSRPRRCCGSVRPA